MRLWMQMASKRGARRSACQGKIAYPDDEPGCKAAFKAARALTRDSGEVFHAYQCTHCHKWHTRRIKEKH